MFFQFGLRSLERLKLHLVSIPQHHFITELIIPAFHQCLFIDKIKLWD